MNLVSLSNIIDSDKLLAPGSGGKKKGYLEFGCNMSLQCFKKLCLVIKMSLKSYKRRICSRFMVICIYNSGSFV